MSIPGSANPMLLASAAGGPTGYLIERSLRFNSSDSAYCSRVPGSAGNRRTWSWAGWLKKSADGGIFESYTSGATLTSLRFLSNTIELVTLVGGAYTGIGMRVGTTAVFRDHSAWYHLVLAFDTTQAAVTDAVKIYINGVQQVVSLKSGAYTQNSDHYINFTYAHQIGTYNNDSYLSGYLADLHFIDGQALDPTSFGEFDTNGIWQPKAFAGSYGTQGWHLDFADNSSNTATTLGKDTSPNGNNWTPNNLSVTAGAGNDSVVDVPTNGAQTDTGAGGEVRGNYATWNPLFGTPGTFSNGNLQVVTTLGTWYHSTTTMFTPAGTGKWYWEFQLAAQTGTNYTMIGMTPTDGTLRQNVSNLHSEVGGMYVYIGFNGSVAAAAGAATTGTATSTIGVGDIVGWAFDAENGTVQCYINGVSQGTQFTNVRTNVGWMFSAHDYDPSSSGTYIINFGQRPFAYTAPSGFKALNTANLPAPLVTKPSTVMDVKLYTGNGSTQTISGLGFSPDLVWLKARNDGLTHQIYDVVRGVNRWLESNTTASESFLGNTLTSFDSSGFTLGSSEASNAVGISSVAWTWDAGSSTVTNTVGSISSQVRANASAGFSVVTYTGTGSSATVGHGLGVAPSWIIIKNRTTSYDWIVYVNESGTLKQLYLSLTLGSAGAGLSLPSSTTFNLGGGGPTGSNANADTYVAYCFAPVAGYSSFGSYTGNGSADGPFVYLGFQPAFVLVKMSSSTGNWTTLDSKREGYNVDNDPLFPNTNVAEGTTDLIDITSNGFKVRTTDATFNTNTGTYVYAAWAESPFQFSRAR